jgi:hypothetical protein
MDLLKKSLEDELEVNKPINIVESNQHGFLFEIEKKEGDTAFRKTKKKFKTISIKNRLMTFTCTDLQNLVKHF